MTVRFVHAADLHLDLPFVGLRDADAGIGERLQDATFRAFSRVVDVCLREAVDFAIFAGDLFAGDHRSLRGEFRLADGLRRLSEAGIPNFVVNGNHDPWDEWPARLRWPEQAHRFGPDEVGSVAVERGGETLCQVYGISFGRREVHENLAQRFRRDDRAPFAIGVLHTEVGGRQGQSPYAPCSLEDLRAINFDYWALGHIHTRQTLHPADPCIVYPGNPQGLNPNETGPRGCYLVTLEQGQAPRLDLWVTSDVEWQHLAVSIEGLEDAQELPIAVEEPLEELRRTSEAGLLLVRLVLTGAGPLHTWLAQPESRVEALAAVREAVSGSAGSVWIESIQDATRTPIDLDARAEGDDFVGEFLRLADAAKADEQVLVELREELGGLLSQPEVARRATVTVTDDRLREWLDAARVLGAERLIAEGGQP